MLQVNHFIFCHLLAFFSSLMAFLQDSLLDAPKEDGFMTFLKLTTLNLVDLKFNPFFSSHNVFTLKLDYDIAALMIYKADIFLLWLTCSNSETG